MFKFINNVKNRFFPPSASEISVNNQVELVLSDLELHGDLWHWVPTYDYRFWYLNRLSVDNNLCIVSLKLSYKNSRFWYVTWDDSYVDTNLTPTFFPKSQIKAICKVANKMFCQDKLNKEMISYENLKKALS